jgi:hypothetical protein
MVGDAIESISAEIAGEIKSNNNYINENITINYEGNFP